MAIGVKAVARLTGLSEHTIRAWERRYQAITPSRSPTSRRIYKMQDIHRLRSLNELTSRGYSIGFIASLPNRNLLKLIIESDKSGGTRFKLRSSKKGKLSRSESLEPGSKTTQTVISALKEFNLVKVNNLLIRDRVQMTPRAFILRTLCPLFRELGKLVQIGSVSVAKEHALSAIIRDHISQLRAKIISPLIWRPQRTVILTTPEGDLHEFGALLTTVFCAIHGIRYYYLGPSLPAKELAYVANTLRATTIVLGTKNISEDLLHEPLASYVSHLNRSLKPACDFWIGGDGPFNFSELKSSRQIIHVATLDLADQMLTRGQRDEQ